MNTAALTEPIEILEIRYSGNTLGADVPFYVPFLTLYGSITGQRGNTGFDQTLVYTDRISFYIRYNPTIRKKGFILKYQGELYEIENVTSVRREATIIDCSLTS